MTNGHRDIRINAKAEPEIELLHHTIDALREREIMTPIDIIERLSPSPLAPVLAAAAEAKVSVP